MEIAFVYVPRNKTKNSSRKNGIKRKVKLAGVNDYLLIFFKCLMGNGDAINQTILKVVCLFLKITKLRRSESFCDKKRVFVVTWKR